MNAISLGTAIAIVGVALITVKLTLAKKIDRSDVSKLRKILYLGTLVILPSSLALVIGIKLLLSYFWVQE